MTAHRRAAIVVSAALSCGAPVAAPVVPDCPADRGVVLSRQTDVARLAGCSTLHGLTVRTAASLDLSALRALTTITGDLVIGPTVAIEDIALPALRTVGGAIHVVGNGLLQRLRLPRLERAGQIVIDGNPAATAISLPRLHVVHGAVRITDNAALELVDLAALARVDQELVLAGDPNLSILEAEQLQHTSAVRVDAPKLPPDVADHLLRATGGH
jgi:hypothetical protein